MKCALIGMSKAEVITRCKYCYKQDKVLSDLMAAVHQWLMWPKDGMGKAEMECVARMMAAYEAARQLV